MTDDDGGQEVVATASCVSKATMNRLVMDYLVIEGHKEAAESFQVESKTPAGFDLETITDRRTIRTAMERGEVARALECALKISPDLCMADADLAFHLDQQQLIELIRADRVKDAISFAQNSLAPKVEQNPTLLAELERTLLLLAYPNPFDSAEADLLSQHQRQNTASRLNAAVLSAQSQDTEAALLMMLRRLSWEHGELQHRHGISYPRVDDFDFASSDLGLCGASEGSTTDLAMDVQMTA